ncbi:hypothetical protein MNBD_ALPHA11-1478 [hydrothermal vent metagenome]|uniref:Uncharacterized protein n=1 Tax=hydrothermal vent metagenome TaxID=652676 RepID=A0A3B0UGV2_9ZZZZ
MHFDHIKARSIYVFKLPSILSLRADNIAPRINSTKNKIA